MARDLTLEALGQYTEEYLENPTKRAVRRALFKSDIVDAAEIMENKQNVMGRFSIDIPTMGATSQGNSGRCWIFAGMNVFREIIAKKCNIKDFEISQNYVAFYDKLEKINFFLESVIDLRDKDYTDRTLWWVLTQGVSDGGQWDMLTAVIKKYGLVPKDAMPESYQSSHTRWMNKLMNRRLRRFAKEVKDVNGNMEAIYALKEECVKEMYGYLCTCFGVPPKSFSFEYVDANNEYHLDENLTPYTFYEKYVGEDLDDYVSLINSPTDDKPYYQMFTVKYLGSVWGTPIRHLNLPMDEFKSTVLAQLSDKEVVWFGSDCGNYGIRKEGSWDQASFDFAGLFGMDFDLDKEHALYTCESAMNHAMVLTGVN
ncbi:MAG: hypothetical protein HUJ58_01620, partial [Erysipelotrichaceae bacterium]|nr:hypothetical protein [Erysipelotrichaceae bacterium]